MPTLKSTYKEIIEALSKSGIQSADQESREILHHRLNITWTDIIARPEMPVSPEDEKQIKKDLQARISGISLGRLYGTKNFYGYDFELSQDTLEPRADTEILVDLALKRFPGGVHSVLDLGTGTGCILLTLLKEWPDARGIGVDIAPGAIKTAQRNAQNLGVSDRATFIQGSWADNIEQTFDLVVSNPPYIESAVIPGLSTEVQNHDPILALDGGKDGLEAYKIIFSQAPRILKPGGLALFEIGYDQSRKVTRIVEDAGLTAKHVHPDMAGRPRVLEVCFKHGVGIK